MAAADPSPSPGVGDRGARMCWVGVMLPYVCRGLAGAAGGEQSVEQGRRGLKRKHEGKEALAEKMLHKTERELKAGGMSS